MRLNLSLTVIGFCFLFLLSCTTDKKEENAIQPHIDAVQKQYAPDKRTALFSVDVVSEKNRVILKGESNLPEAVASLQNILTKNSIDFIDSIQLLPSPELGDTIMALVTISVANLRSNPKHSAELATQATLGTPLKILKKEDNWYLVQTPDKYLSWVDAGGITPMTEQQLNNWRTNDKIIYTKTYGHSYLGPEKENIVSDLVAGSVLEILKFADKFYIVRYPDGRTGYVSNEEAMEYETWLTDLDLNEDQLITTAEKLMGVPYLWGGTSTKGVDCSGFTKTIYFLNGLIIPRDASQQVHTGKPIDSIGNFENLQKGDLLFFGRKATDSTAEKVVHVGMWIGNNEFIHSSEMVRISSMDANASNYDEHNHNRYLRSKRVLKEQDEALINLKRSFTFNNLK